VTRRESIAAGILIALSAGTGDGPGSKNHVARLANQFIDQLGNWAQEMNRLTPSTIGLKEIQAWEPLAELWRQLEKAHRQWLRAQPEPT
jgi:hypothetical protein